MLGKLSHSYNYCGKTNLLTNNCKIQYCFLQVKISSDIFGIVFEDTHSIFCNFILATMIYKYLGHEFVGLGK